MTIGYRTVGANFSYSKKDEKYTVDSLVLEPNRSKIERIGKLRKRTFLIKCDGEGNYSFEELKTDKEKMKELKIFLDKGFLTHKEYEQKRKSILHVD